MAFRNIPPNGFPAIPDIEDLEAVVKDVSTLKTTTAGLAEDVSDLEEQKANQITIALPFNPETEYEVGDLVYYDGLTYRCTNAHTGEWDADDFAGTTIANELATLKSGLTNAVTGTAAMQSNHTINEAVLSRCGMVYIGYFNITLTSAVSAWSNFAHIEANLKYTSLCYAVSGGSNKIVYCTTGGNVQATQELESGTTLHIVLCAVANFN